MDKIIEAAKGRFCSRVGSGLSESCYSKCMALKLRESFTNGVRSFDRVEVEKSVPIIYMGHEIAVLRADIVVDGKFILELKAVKNKLSDSDRNQLRRYMKVLKIDSGLLVNFGNVLEFEEISG